MIFMIRRWQKDTAGMKSSGCPKERTEGTIHRRGQAFQAGCQEQVSDAFGIYYRLYITYTLAGFLFDLDQSNICRDMQKIEPLVRKCVPIPQKMYSLSKRLRTPEEVEKCFPGFMSFTDCTEQQIPRPESKRRRKMYYSGKRKRHTVKTQLTVNNQGVIIHKTGHKKGKRHDYDIYKRNHPVTPKQVVSVFDLGYIGVGKDFPEQLSSLPSRKRRSQKESVA